MHFIWFSGALQSKLMSFILIYTRGFALECRSHWVNWWPLCIDKWLEVYQEMQSKWVLLWEKCSRRLCLEGHAWKFKLRVMHEKCSRKQMGYLVNWGPCMKDRWKFKLLWFTCSMFLWSNPQISIYQMKLLLHICVKRKKITT